MFPLLAQDTPPEPPPVDPAPLTTAPPPPEPALSADYVMYIAEHYLLPAVGFLLVLLVAYMIGKWLGRMTTGAARKSKVDETLAKFFGKLVFYIVMIAAGVSALGYLGVNVAPFAAIIAAAGFAIGLAFQGTLSNFSAGVMLLVFRPFKVGDVITAAGVTAKVNEIELFTTTLDSPDNRRFIVPNSSIFGSTIENISHHPTRRVDVNVGTAYAADLDRARAVLMDAAGSVEGVLPDPAPAIVLVGLGASSVDWQVRVWVDAADYWAVKDALTRMVKLKLDEAGVVIPFPQMRVHLDKPAT